VPTRYFLSKPDIGEELTISIEQGKTLTIKLLAVGPLNTDKGTRECFFELNGETRAVVITDRNAAIEHVSREKATSDPGSVGSPMSGVVIDVRVKEGAEVKAGDPLCVLSAMKMESVVSSPVSGKVKRVLVNENDSIAQGDLVVEITH
jgi:pyruvate carboxylase